MFIASKISSRTLYILYAVVSDGETVYVSSDRAGAVSGVEYVSLDGGFPAFGVEKTYSLVWDWLAGSSRSSGIEISL